MESSQSSSENSDIETKTHEKATDEPVSTPEKDSSENQPQSSQENEPEKKPDNSNMPKKNVLISLIIILILAAFYLFSTPDTSTTPAGDAITTMPSAEQVAQSAAIEEKLRECNTYLAEEDYNASIICLNGAILIKNDSRIYEALGDIYFILGDTNESVSNYMQALAIDPSDKKLWYNMAVYMENSGDLDGAKGAYEFALGLDPDYVAAQNNLAIIFQKKGMLNESRTSFEQALEIEPNASIIILNYANLLAELGENTLADENYKKSIALDNTSKSAYRNYAQFLYNNGNYIDAKANLEKSY